MNVLKLTNILFLVFALTMVTAFPSFTANADEDTLQPWAEGERRVAPIA